MQTLSLEIPETHWELAVERSGDEGQSVGGPSTSRDLGLVTVELQNTGSSLVEEKESAGGSILDSLNRANLGIPKSCEVIVRTTEQFRVVRAPSDEGNRIIDSGKSVKDNKG